jgi:hypothetical protein
MQGGRVDIPLEVLINERDRQERLRSREERPFLEVPRPQPEPRHSEEAPKKSETVIRIGHDDESDESDRGVVIISIWGD